jgi:type IV secretory pathway VirD2 relaxase
MRLIVIVEKSNSDGTKRKLQQLKAEGNETVTNCLGLKKNKLVTNCHQLKIRMIIHDEKDIFII